MKRFLVFVLVFGVGLGLLLYLQGQQSSKLQKIGFEHDQLDPELVPLPTPLGTGDTPGKQPKSNDSPVAGRVGLKGHFKGMGYPKGGGDAIFVLTANDASTATEGWLNLKDLTLTYLGVGVLVAESGRVVFEENGEALAQGSLGGTVELNDGVLTLEDSHPLAPATFSSSFISGDLERRIFDLSNGPQLESQNLRVNGDEIHLDLNNNRVSVRGNAVARVLAENGTTEYALMGDQLSLNEQTPSRTHVQAKGQAHLSLGPRPEYPQFTDLWAPTIDIDAERQPKTEQVDRLTLTSVQVSGGRGRLASGDATLSGDVFDFVFGGPGSPRQVIVSGEARASFPAELAQSANLKALTIAPNEHILLTSVDKITLALSDDINILTTGLSTLSLLGLTLEAGGGFKGSHKKAAKTLDLLGRGGVALFGELPEESSDGDPRLVNYRSDELTIIHEIRTDGSLTTLSSKGLTRLEVAKGDQNSAWFESTKALNLELLEVADATTWSIPTAKMLVFDIVAEGMRTTGSASHISNFDPVQLHFSGKNLTIDRKPLNGTDLDDSRNLSAHGAVVEAEGELDLTIKGDELDLAHFSGAGFSIDAGRLRRLGTTLDASGTVTAKFDNQGQMTRFDCEGLTVEGLLTGNGRPTTATRLVANGAVDASAPMGNQTLNLRAERVELQNLGGDELELHVLHGVELAMREGDTEWVIDADQIDAFSFGSESNPPSDGSNWLDLVANGNITISEATRGFSGRGELFSISRGPSSKALLEGGQEPAWATSQLPSGGTYEGLATRLTFNGEIFSAEHVTGSISGAFLPGSTKEEGAGRLDLVCDLLSVNVERFAEEVRDVLQLDGSVKVSRQSPNGVKESLQAEHVTFNHLRSSADDQPRTFEPLRTSFLAHGQVALHRGFEFHAVGNRLAVEAGSQELRFEGAPAAVIYAGFLSMSDWVTFNPTSMLVESGTGTVCQDPAIIRRLVPKEEDL